MTIIIAFHASSFRDFKHFYLMLRLRHRADFPGLVSYTRFVQLMPSLVIPLSAYLQTCYGKDTGIAFIDSTALAVCGNKRIRRNRVFHGLAKLGKTTMGVAAQQNVRSSAQIKFRYLEERIVPSFQVAL
jgi:hypothetical protein